MSLSELKCAADRRLSSALSILTWRSSAVDSFHIAQMKASAIFVSAAQSISRPRPGRGGTVIGSSFRNLSPFMCSVE